LIVWRSKKQDVIALSTAESEIIAASETAKDVVMCVNFATQMKMYQTINAVINIDNIAAIFIANNRVNNSRTRHIDMRYMFIRDLIEKGIVRAQHVESKENVSDIFTKALCRELLAEHRASLGVAPLPKPN
jgi:hypothetical protein